MTKATPPHGPLANKPPNLRKRRPLLRRHHLPQPKDPNPIHRQNDQPIARNRKIRQRRPPLILQRLCIKHAEDLPRRAPHHDAVVLARPDAAVVVDVDAVGVAAHGGEEAFVDGEAVGVEVVAEDDGVAVAVFGAAGLVEGGGVAGDVEVGAGGVAADAVGRDHVGACDYRLEGLRLRREAVDGVGEEGGLLAEVVEGRSRRS